MTSGLNGITDDSQDFKKWNVPSGSSVAISGKWVNGLTLAVKSFVSWGSINTAMEESMKLYNDYDPNFFKFKSYKTIDTIPIKIRRHDSWGRYINGNDTVHKKHMMIIMDNDTLKL